jgi:hypothetical protein
MGNGSTRRALARQQHRRLGKDDASEALFKRLIQAVIRWKLVCDESVTKRWGAMALTTTRSPLGARSTATALIDCGPLPAVRKPRLFLLPL